MKILTKKHLLEALKAEGLPSSYKTLLKFERLGIIPVRGAVERSGNWRLYTEQEIKEIVEMVKNHKDKVEDDTDA